MVAGGLVGAVIVPQIFDSIIIGASAFGGATMAMAGAHLLLPGVGLFDRFAEGFAPRLMTIILAVVGIGWQFRNIESGFTPAHAWWCSTAARAPGGTIRRAHALVLPIGYEAYCVSSLSALRHGFIGCSWKRCTNILIATDGSEPPAGRRRASRFGQGCAHGRHRDQPWLSIASSDTAAAFMEPRRRAYPR